MEYTPPEVEDHTHPSFESTISVGDYTMPRAGKTSDYKVKGKDK